MGARPLPRRRPAALSARTRQRLDPASPVLFLLLAALAALLLLAGPARADETRARVVAPDEIEAVLAEPDAPLLLDVRTHEEWETGHVPGAQHIPIQELPERLAELEPWRERGIITYCERGPRSERALDVLRDAGFEKVGILAGSMSRWRTEERPIAHPAPELPAETAAE
jgi:rhodanese-related sulfurtransferase